MLIELITTMLPPVRTPPRSLLQREERAPHIHGHDAVIHLDIRVSDETAVGNRDIEDNDVQTTEIAIGTCEKLSDRRGVGGV